MPVLREVTCSIDSRTFHGQVIAGFEAAFHRLVQLIPDQAIAGQTVQVGFSLYRLEASGDQEIRLLSQDFSRNPWQDWTADLSTALYCLQEQVLFTSLLGIVPDDCRFDDKIVIAKGVFEVDSYYLHKSAGSWFIGYQDRDNRDLVSIYAYQLLTFNPNLIKLLNLPDEYLATVAQSEVSSIVDEHDCLIFGS